MKIASFGTTGYMLRCEKCNRFLPQRGQDPRQWVGNDDYCQGCLSEETLEKLFCGNLEFDLDDCELEPDEYPGCACGGGEMWGHRNEAGGWCCPHHGNTCGYDHGWM